ncbi:MAG: protein yceI precursor [Acidobacteriales bacterium]|nr:protein yceI precursor [Terriglobales bacterium]
MRIKSSVISALVLALALSTAAFAADYKIDPAHSSATFNVRHMVISNVPGRFQDVSGTINYDDADVTKSSVEATIKASSITTDNENRDKHLKSADFFDVEKFPEITFKSKKIEKRGNQLVAIGTFTMKGVSKDIELPFELSKLNTPRGTLIGIVAETEINRMDYGVSWNRAIEGGGAVVSEKVKIQLSLEAKPAGAAAPAKTGAAAAPAAAPAKK